MYIDFYDNKKIVFVAQVSPELQPERVRLVNILGKAGFEVLNPENNLFTNLQVLEKTTLQLLNTSNCSIHLLGNTYSTELENSKLSISEIQYQIAADMVETNNKQLRIFVWHPHKISANTIENKQQNLVNSIKNSIITNTSFFTLNAAVAFVDEIRTLLNRKTEKIHITEESDITFIYNGLDTQYAKDILYLLEDVVKVKEISIGANSETDYSEFVSQQLAKSKLGIIYFCTASEWAYPFTQQIWKITGGASSHIPLLFIADKKYPENDSKLFSAPNLTGLSLDKEFIPVEILTNYQKLN